MAAIPQQLIGSSPAFLATLDHISQAAALDMPVLVIGERGTGKHIIAQRLHFLSPRWEQNYEEIDCAALDGDDLAARLFERGGLAERASGGTLAFHHIEALPRRIQRQILTLISTGQFFRPDENEPLSINIRAVLTSGADLPRLAQSGVFLPALLDVISTDVITLPPLSRRREDILLLAEYFGRKFAAGKGAQSFPGFTPEISEALLGAAWPGNIRQLKTTIERAASDALTEQNNFDGPIARISFDPFDSPWRLTGALGEAGRTDIAQTLLADPAPAAPDDSLDDPGAPNVPELTGPQQSFKDRVFAFERTLIDQALAAHDDHQGQAAVSLGLSYHAFRGLLRKHGLKK